MTIAVQPSVVLDLAEWEIWINMMKKGSFAVPVTGSKVNTFKQPLEYLEKKFPFLPFFLTFLN